jgi:ribonucleotide reductase beta subunit family protein with ferritin-like domain
LAQRGAVRAIRALYCQPPLCQLGLGPVFKETENPFPWMSEAMDLKKEKNFFETRVIEYQNGGALSWG